MFVSHEFPLSFKIGIIWNISNVSKPYCQVKNPAKNCSGNATLVAAVTIATGPAAPGRAGRSAWYGNRQRSSWKYKTSLILLTTRAWGSPPPNEPVRNDAIHPRSRVVQISLLFNCCIEGGGGTLKEMWKRKKVRGYYAGGVELWV